MKFSQNKVHQTFTQSLLIPTFSNNPAYLVYEQSSLVCCSKAVKRN